MSKKRKYKSISRIDKEISGYGYPSKSYKKLNKEFDKALEDIQYSKLRIYESDKRGQKSKKRKEINKKERMFYDDMKAIRGRQLLASEWERTGFLDFILDILHKVFPIVRIIARLFADMIIQFLKCDSIKTRIKPTTLSKIQKTFNFAISL